MSAAVLWGDGSEETSLDNDVEFSGTRMDVRSIEATRTQESNRNSSALAHKSREGRVVRSNGLSAISLSDTSDAVGSEKSKMKSSS